jgi:hypothetical protein
LRYIHTAQDGQHAFRVPTNRRYLQRLTIKKSEFVATFWEFHWTNGRTLPCMTGQVDERKVSRGLESKIVPTDQMVDPILDFFDDLTPPGRTREFRR